MSVSSSMIGISHALPPSLERGGGRQGAAARAALVVEDDVEIADTLAEVLHTLGYETWCCTNGREALEHLRRGPHPDVILLDLRLPVMDGWEFRVEQRKDPDLASIPVVVLSADGAPKAAAIDADAYLTKPVDFDRLASTVERVVLVHENRILQTQLLEAERLRSLGTLAAGMAHEINNPLSYAMLNIAFVREKLTPPVAPRDGVALGDLARDAELRKKLLEHIANAELGMTRIGAIVRGLRLFSHPEIEPRALVDVRDVLAATIPMLEPEIRARARLVTEYADVPWVDANEARLGQVFLNLLLNAAQSVAGPVEDNEIRVRVRNAPPQVIVEVHDTGSGIPEDIRGRIFEPFFTTKPAGVGTGLGLSISHGIVRSLGGELTFETEVGRGSVFRVALTSLRALRRRHFLPELRLSVAEDPTRSLRPDLLRRAGETPAKGTSRRLGGRSPPHRTTCPPCTKPPPGTQRNRRSPRCVHPRPLFRPTQRSTCDALTCPESVHGSSTNSTGRHRTLRAF